MDSVTQPMRGVFVASFLVVAAVAAAVAFIDTAARSTAMPVVDINEGNDDQLRERLSFVPRLSPSLADRIVQLRIAHGGGFPSMDVLISEVKRTSKPNYPRDTIGRKMAAHLCARQGELC